jgi:DNA-binding transcriptional ArsR family regulator
MTAPPPDLGPAAALLKVLADDTRLRIVALLARGELCVCHIAAALELGQPNASQHLGVLRKAEVVHATRRGSWIYYSLRTDLDPARAGILDAVLIGVAGVTHADVGRLAALRPGIGCS